MKNVTGNESPANNGASSLVGRAFTARRFLAPTPANESPANNGASSLVGRASTARRFIAPTPASESPANNGASSLVGRAFTARRFLATTPASESPANNTAPSLVGRTFTARRFIATTPASESPANNAASSLVGRAFTARRFIAPTPASESPANNTAPSLATTPANESPANNTAPSLVGRTFTARRFIAPTPASESPADNAAPSLATTPASESPANIGAPSLATTPASESPANNAASSLVGRAFTARRSCPGFTLIEMLVAVSVLAVISLLLARIVSQTNKITFDGTRQASQNAGARLAMEQFNTDFIQAFAHGRVGCQWEPEATFAYEVFPCDRFRFAAALSTPEPYEEGGSGEAIADRIREAVRVCYYVNELADNPGVYSLMRATSPTPATPYTNVWSGFNPRANAYELMRYVVEFRTVCVATNGAAFPAGVRPELPVYVDLFLAVLSESDVRQARTFTDRDMRTAFITRRAQRYHTRCVALRHNVYLDGRW